MKIIPDFVKRKYIKLYSSSKIFRNLSNSSGIGLGSSFFYAMSAGGTCPFCGQAVASCPIGIGTLGVFGGLFGGGSFVFLSLRDLYEKLRRKLGWKEKKSSN